MQGGTLCRRQYLHAPLLCQGALCQVFHQPGKHPPYTQVLGCEGGRATQMAPDATTEEDTGWKQSRFNSRQVTRSNPFMIKEAPGGGESGQQDQKWDKVNKKKTYKKKQWTSCSLAITTSALSMLCLSLPASLLLRVSSLCLIFWFTSSALAARFTSRNLLASSWLLCHDAISLFAPNRTFMYHGTPASLRAASVQTSLSTPKVRRSLGVEPCRAPNALESSLKLFCQWCAGCPGPGLLPIESSGEQQPLWESLVTFSG